MVHTTQIRQRKQNTDLINIVKEQIYSNSKLFLWHCSGLLLSHLEKAKQSKTQKHLF